MLFQLLWPERKLPISGNWPTYCNLETLNWQQDYYCDSNEYLDEYDHRPLDSKYACKQKED